MKNLKNILKRSLAEIEKPLNTFSIIDDNSKKLTWTGSKIALIELLYAFQSIGVFNHSNTDVRQIATYFEAVFNVKWKATILLPGMKAERQLQKTVKCFVKRTTEGNQENKKTGKTAIITQLTNYPNPL